VREDFFIWPLLRSYEHGARGVYCVVVAEENGGCCYFCIGDMMDVKELVFHNSGHMKKCVLC